MRHSNTPFPFLRRVVKLLIILLSFQAAFPTNLSALTSGPAQPEFTAFEPVGTTDMVNLFSGDFVYNIPLFELPGPDGGYPFNLAYHSGVTMDQEASWVGLGWTLNHGAITRMMRGFPDEFKQEEVEQNMHTKPNTTWTVSATGHVELVGFNPKEDRVPKFNKDFNARLGLSVSHNSYRGWGLAANLGLSPKFTSVKYGHTYSGDLSLGISSVEAADLNASFSMGRVKEEMTRKYTLGLGVNSIQGMQTLSLGYNKEEKSIKNTDEGQVVSYDTKFNWGTNISFARQTYIPQVSQPYRGMNFTGGLEAGGTVSFAAIGGDLSLSYNRQRLKHNGEWIKQKASGYLHMDGEINDFNRTADGPLVKSSPNLALPTTTPDLFMVKGQGTGGSFRAYRSDIGILKDPKEISLTGGGELMAELNPGTGIDVGLDGGFNVAVSGSRPWAVANSSPINAYEYGQKSTDPAFETYYFKMAGEQTAEPLNTYQSIGGEKAVRLKLAGSAGRMQYDPLGILVDADRNTSSISASARPTRKPRLNAILPIKNRELLGPNLTEALSEYKQQYYNLSQRNRYRNDPQQFIRDNSRGEHFAGITDLKPNGMRYVYGLPVLNKNHEEIVFTVQPLAANDPNPVTKDYTTKIGDEQVNYKLSNSDEFYSHTKLPPYVHTHLLTAVLGSDYVDADDIPGPSDGDYGYWVKFTYIKTSDNYKWRTPYLGASYLPGSRNKSEDDKGSIMYGSREQYYLATAETRSHVAEFFIRERADGAGAISRFQRSATPTSVENRSYRLDKIELFSKLERYSGTNGAYNQNARPIKTVRFKYDQSLCNNIHNRFDNSGKGKLTLTRVSFTYGKNNRGLLSPYKFTYANNKSYSDMHYDRWGTYRLPRGEDIRDFPYTYQDNRAEADLNASTWNLDEISLPSGAKIKVKYEADDYAYVQDRRAMQMIKITGIGSSPTNLSIPTGKDPNDDSRRLYFEMNGESPIERYLEGLHGVVKNTDGTLDMSNSQVYYKAQIDLNKSGSYEPISGYAKIKSYTTTTLNGKTYGVLVLKAVKSGTALVSKDYHPFALAAWQYMKLNFPSLIVEGEDLDQYDENNFRDALGSFAKAFGSIGAIFTQYYTYCSNKGFADKFRQDYSYIRLCEPTKAKVGGGARVQKITLEDNWDIDGNGTNDNSNSTYGQYYDYTTLDEEGNTISSGVAVNEPSVGYDECPLRYAKEYSEHNKLFKTADNLFFEYPINESYYPGASVGYSKVTVKSLATHYATLDSPSEDPDYPTANLPNGFATTGVTENEFFTAKDFPVLVEETDNPAKVNVPQLIPLGLINITDFRYTSSQGYAIILNDMHGKPERVTHYGLDQNSNLIETPINKVEYTYNSSNSKVYNVAGEFKKANALDNQVDVLVSDDMNNVNAVIEKQELGVDYEFFMDMRESYSFSGNTRFRTNIKFEPSFFLGFNFLPGITINNSETRTSVMNKIIRKSGILTRTDAYDGQSHITTTNRVFDALTGEPLLTTVNNSYDDLVYSYNIPARFAYDRMGPAYENIGHTFSAEIFTNTCGYFQLANLSNNAQQVLIEGDECVVTGFLSTDDNCSNNSDLCDNRKFIYVGKIGEGSFIFENRGLTELVDGVNVNLLITRSGNRNHLSAKSGSIAALKNPTIDRNGFNTTNIDIPTPQNATASTIITIPITFNSIDSVLNASAVTYANEWDLERHLSFDSVVTQEIDTTNTCPTYFLRVEWPGYAGPPGVVLCPQENNGLVTVRVYFKVGGSPRIFEQDFSVGVNKSVTMFFDQQVTVDSITPDAQAVVPLPEDNCGAYAYTGQNLVPCNRNIDTLSLERKYYSFGEKGIWRPNQNYVYNSQRLPTQLPNAENLSLRTAGVSNQVPLFNWQNPFFPQAPIADGWKMTNQITKYNRAGEEVENRDIIGLYSAALYGYNDNVPTAVASNANYYEIAYQGFEQVSSLGGIDGKGNFDFVATPTIKKFTSTHNIVGAYGTNTRNVVWIDKPFSLSDLTAPPLSALLILEDELGREYEVVFEILTATAKDPTTAGLDLAFRQDITQLTLNQVSTCGIPTRTMTGKVVLYYEADYGTNDVVSATVTTTAHTGRRSLRVDGPLELPMKRMQLLPNKNYVVSLWMKSTKTGEEQKPSYSDETQFFGVKMGNGTTQYFVPAGEMINGWQRIEGVFNSGSSTVDNTLRLLLTPTYNDHQYCIDDIRIYPEDGSLQTYVYDSKDYRLRATLDQNNYATLYRYDEEGNLILVKKETARGIKTIQENQQFVKNTK